MAFKNLRPKFGKHLSASELKEFRRYVSQLKKEGKIKTSIDARSARPYFLSNGKTLQSIVNKNLSETKLPASKPRKQKSFYVRDLGLKAKSLATAFNEIEKNPKLIKRINSMLKPGERFAFDIEGTHSMMTFPDIELLIDEAFKYGKDIKGNPRMPWGSQDIYHKRSKSVALFDKLKIVTWNKGLTEWRSTTHPKPKKKKAKKSAKKRRK